VHLAFAVLPIFLVTLIGFLLAQSKTIARDRWTDIETLCYRALIPALLISTISTSDLSLSRFGPMIAALLISLAILVCVMLVLRWFTPQQRLPNAKFTSVFQGTVRWNGFIALPAAAQFFGPSGFALMAVVFAVMVPIINVITISVLATFGPSKTTPLALLKTILRNPIVASCIIGLAINQSGLILPTPIQTTVDLLGRAALAIGLLSVGAAIRPATLFNRSAALWLTILLRFTLSPAIFLICAHLIGLSQIQTLVGTLVFSVPAASNGYIISKQMGGDADLYATILTWQTLISMFTLPLLVFMLT
jgi:malonate transporter